MGDKEAVEKAIADKEKAEHELGQGTGQGTGEHPRGDISNPQGNPTVSNRTESGKPFTGFESGHPAERESRNEPLNRGIGGSPSNQQRQLTPEERREGGKGGGKGP